MKSRSLSVIILTLNEELHLESCLRSVQGLAGRIVVVDSFSSDRTKAIAQEFGAEVHEHAFKNQADQFNWALDHLDIESEWILKLDADEYLTPELADEIKELLAKAPESVDGYFIKRRVYFMGRWIRHGGYYPTWFLRLWRTGKARAEDKEMDEHIVLLSGVAGKLKHDFVDENLHDLEWWTAKQNVYSSREVKEMMKKQRGVGIQADLAGGQSERKQWLKQNVYLRAPRFFRAFIFFCYRYFLRFGFLDGKKGLIFHFLQAFWYRFLVDAKLYEAEKKRYEQR